MKDWTEEERELFLESRRLKEKARGMVARRKAAQAYSERLYQDRLKESIRKAEEAKRLAAKEAMDKRDERIRHFLISTANGAKFSKLAFESGSDGVVKFGFHLFDKDQSSPTYGKRIAINITSNGFQWT